MLNNELLPIKLLVDEKVVIETLSRMGIPNISERKLYQSCHLFKQFGEVYLAHFKQLFVFATSKNGEPGFGNVSQEDLIRRNAIALRLINWGLISADKSKLENSSCKIFCVPYKDKAKWQLIQKINVDNLFTLG